MPQRPATTRRCGTPRKRFSRLWLLGGAVAPTSARRRSDDDWAPAAPSYIAPYFAMWLTIWSKHRVKKSPNVISDRPKAGDGESCGDPSDRGLADRGGADAPRIIRAEPARDLERAAIGVDDILAEQDHPRIGLQCVAQAVAERTCADNDARQLVGVQAAPAHDERVVCPTAPGPPRPALLSSFLE